MSNNIKLLKDSGFNIKFLQKGDGFNIQDSDTIWITYRIYYEDNPTLSLYTSSTGGSERPLIIDNFDISSKHLDMVGFYMVLKNLKEGDAVKTNIPINFQKTYKNQMVTNFKIDYKKDVTLDLLVAKVIKNNKNMGEV